ncbi:hemolysin family protein [Clostridium luticellarii]|jgi:putative hemolysin|uniref:Magnesium and cobalt efflux protein CorC n=1 Tax=Clostridium luticellarii TaxID=1691940 RepID=A0A2T0BER2_9CLOT|nr:hemolysin family protein [Clostridium luticellarii]MCI1944832.1 hemolysin family protein [Clostridium luticellarii]MCI1968352.1 hemolysin family protein [Clostridium luticellarii]MCI1995350.1 hemolysin family protein [Clostridium luticellarii]MCI2039388.1 hemolysin family protein [Clostridium luticellarii]PRR82374.1 Magnesium and cobalt efflux protein CorC [Clostridium luticellarii]
MDVTWQSIVFELMLILVLTVINAFFSAIEMAIVAVNRSRMNYLAEEGNKKAEIILNLLKKPNNFLATIQVGITFAGFFASAYAATTLSTKLAFFLNRFGILYSDKLSVIIITLLLSYITLVFGELLPKRIALQNSEALSMSLVKPILFISKLMLPFVKLLSGSTAVLMKLFNISTENIENRVSEEEIRSMLEEGQETGVFNQSEKEMIEGVFKFDDKLAKEVMTPRTEVFVIDMDELNSCTVEDIIEEKYSRIPVYKDDIDNIVGILYIKDLFAQLMKTPINDIDIKSMLRAPYFVPENKNIDVLFKELQGTKNHMAILIDEYGGFSGIVTIEDLIEEVMGNIFDEYDDNEQYINKIDQNTYLVSGLLSIDEVNEFLNLDLKSENSDTIGGFVMDLLGSIPKEGEENTVEYEDVIFKVQKVNEKRIENLKIYTPKKVTD